MGWYKDNVIKCKRKRKKNKQTKKAMWEHEGEKKNLYYPSMSNICPNPGKQGHNKHSSLGIQMSS